MAKPLPSWIERAKSMKVYEVIIVEGERAAVSAILRRLSPLRFKTKAVPTGRRIERVE